MSNDKQNKECAYQSVRVIVRVSLLMFSFVLAVQIVSAQVGSGGYGANELEGGNQTGRVSGGVFAPPTAFAGTERPDIGAFTMSEPLLSLPGRGVSLNLNLNYDSHLYQKAEAFNPHHVFIETVRGDNLNPYIYMDPVKGFPAYGFTLGFGVLAFHQHFLSCIEHQIPETSSCIGTPSPPTPNIGPPVPVFIDNAGAHHPFAGSLSSDGSNLRLLQESGTTKSVTYPDGTKILFGLFLWWPTQTLPSQEWLCQVNGMRRRTCTIYESYYYPTKIIDRNGNYITIDYLVNPTNSASFGGPHIRRIVDTLGREIFFNYDANGWRLLSIDAPGFAQNSRRDVARFYYEGLARVHSFDNASSTENVTILRHLYFPATRTGLRYSYSTYGMIWKIERLRGMDVAADGTVTGTVVASTEYDYPQTPQNLQAQIPKYTKRIDWLLERNGVIEHLFDVTSGPEANTSVTSVTAPDNTVSQIKRRFYDYKRPVDDNLLAMTLQWDDGLVLEVKVTKSGRQFLLEKTEWENSHTGARVLEQNTTIDDGLPKKVRYEYYDPPCSTCAGVYNNPKVVREYGFDGVEIRRTETAFVLDGQYIVRWLVSLPTSVKIFDSQTNTLASEVDFEYDTQPTLQSYGAVPMYQDPGTPYRGNCSRVTTNTNAGDPGSGISVSNSSEYDTVGNLIGVTDANGNQSRMEYSADYHRAYRTASLSAIPDTNSNDGISGLTEALSSLTNYNFNTGLTVSSTNPNGQIATIEYDGALRPSLMTGTNGGTQMITEYGDEPGSRFVKIRKQIDENVWEEGITYLDSIDRPIKTKTSDALGDIFTETIFDFMGRAAKTSSAYRPGDEEKWVETVYDALGRVEQVISPQVAGEVPAKIVTQYAGSPLGQVQISTNQAGFQARSITDAVGRLVRVDEPNATNELGPIDTPFQPTFYKYDVLGLVRKITQGGQARYFMYDSLGRLVRVRQPEQDVNSTLAVLDAVSGNSQWSTALEYDGNGNVVKTTDAKGVETHIKYDNINRVLERSYLVPQTTDPKKITLPTATVTFKYDGVLSPTPNDQNPSLLPFAKGALTEVSNGISMTQQTNFDSQGRITASRQITDGAVYPFSYEYNLSGALIKETYPSGRVVTNDFDAKGDPSGVNSSLPGQPAHVYANNFRYTARGGIDRLQLGNGRWETHKLNARNQITEIAVGTTPTDSSLWKVNYGYGRFNQAGTIDLSKNDGNVLQQTITVPGSTPFVQSYSYDSCNRLVEAKETVAATQNWKQTFGYDQFGNRNSFNYLIGQTAVGLNSINNPSIDSTTNRIQAGQGYEYDYNGNLIQDAEGRKFSFDADNKQREVKANNDATIGTYLYDGTGRRIKKVVAVPQQTTVFVYDAAGKLVAEYGQSQHSGTTYVTSDVLNSPRVLTNSAGDVVSRRDFMPFGEPLLAGRTNPQYGLNDGLRKNFTGYEKDDETQLSFAEARYYNPVQGRFTTVDPLLTSGTSNNPQSFNRYAYAGNNPTLRVDPNGQDWYIYTELKLWGYLSVRVMRYEWHSTYQVDTPARNFIVRFDYGRVQGLVVLDKWENRYKEVASVQEGLAQFEAYKRQAVLNFLAGALETSSLTVQLSGAFNWSSVERNSEMYHAGTNAGIIYQGVSIITGAGLANAVFTRFGKGGVQVLRSVLRGMKAANESREFIVIGRRVETLYRIGQSSTEVLNMSRGVWTLAENMRWLDELIAKRAVFELASPISDATRFTKTGELTVFGQEIQRLWDAGYRQWHNFMLPPLK